MAKHSYKEVKTVFKFFKSPTVDLSDAEKVIQSLRTVFCEVTKELDFQYSSQDSVLDWFEKEYFSMVRRGKNYYNLYEEELFYRKALDRTVETMADFVWSATWYTNRADKKSDKLADAAAKSFKDLWL